MSSFLNRPLSRRGFLIGSIVAAGATLAACSTSSTGQGSSSATNAATDSFPVTVEHAFGSTTIESAPTRVACIGYLNADVIASLGVIPVAAGKVTWGGTDAGSNVWLDKQIANLGAQAPTFYDETDGTNFTALAAASPDLIVCFYGNLSQEDYDKLSKIAPTVTYTAAGANWNESWEGATRQAGKALGKTALAEQLIAETQARLKNVSTSFPELANTTYIAGYLQAGASDEISIYAPTDGRSHLLEGMGLKASDAYNKIDFKGSFYGSWSAERADELDSSIFFTWLNSEEDKAAILGDPLLSKIPAVAHGGLFGVADKAQGIAIYSTIGLNWLLDDSNFVNALVAAAGGHGNEAAPTSTGFAAAN
ncbi:MAG: ABC transporter substrate-binding protein [Corynebacterium sp.]|nr:ABC transporter substrate-binding protein [Corynebacterium sp.]